MPSYQAWASILLLTTIVLRGIHSIIKISHLRKVMPPGPPGLPLLGNMFQVGSFQWLQFTEWKKQYGSIFSLNLADQPVVVLNDFTTAGDLLDRRSNVFSDRPRFIAVNEILTDGMLFAFLSSGDLWRKMRRAAHEGFSSRAAVSFQPLQEKESALLALHVLQDPDNWDNHIRRSVASTVLSAVYGWPPIDTSSDSLVQRINDIGHRVASASMPGAYLVEIFPWMLHLPDWLAKWKREGRVWFEEQTRMFEGLLSDVKQKVHSGPSEPCFVLSLLENEKKHNLSTREASWLAGTMFGAGTETVAATLSFFMLAMVLYPDVMRRAQAQIDGVVGRDRLPSFNDRAQLTYIEAMVKEVLRWRPVGPLGVPRRSCQDDWYKGYFIPKGTLVLFNVWAMNRDPMYFPDYEEFRPERYLDDSGQISDLVPDTHSQGHLTYGAGRRICIGKDVANQSLFMDFATLLWAFNIEKAVDSNGQPITPSPSECVDEGLVVRPVPFKCSITTRSPDVAALIHSMALINDQLGVVLSQLTSNAMNNEVPPLS